MKTTKIILILFLSAALNVSAQTGFGLQNQQGFGGIAERQTAPDHAKLKVNLQMGSMFFSGNHIGSGFGTYIAPIVTVPVDKRFQLQFSTSFYQGFNHSIYTFEPAEKQLNLTKRDVSVTTVRVSGIYHLSDRLSLHGTAYKQFDMSAPQPTANPHAFQFNNEGFTAGFNFNVTDNFQINGAIDYSRGSNPYYNRHLFNNHNPFILPTFTW
jgi:hypothetical protein